LGPRSLAYAKEPMPIPIREELKRYRDITALRERCVLVTRLCEEPGFHQLQDAISDKVSEVGPPYSVGELGSRFNHRRKEDAAKAVRIVEQRVVAESSALVLPPRSVRIGQSEVPTSAIVAVPSQTAYVPTSAIVAMLSKPRRSVRVKENQSCLVPLALPPGVPRKQRKGNSSCYACTISGMKCQRRLSRVLPRNSNCAKKVRVAAKRCSCCIQMGLSFQQCAAPPKVNHSKPIAHRCILKECHICTLPTQEAGSTQCVACGIRVCTREECRLKARICAHAPFYYCAHCLNVPQHCGCEAGCAKLSQLLLHTKLEDQPPKPLLNTTCFVDRNEPEGIENVPAEQRWLIRGASARKWTPTEHLHLVEQLVKLREAAAKLADDNLRRGLVEQWLEAFCLPDFVVAKYLVECHQISNSEDSCPALECFGWHHPVVRQKPKRRRSRRLTEKAKRREKRLKEETRAVVSTVDLTSTTIGDLKNKVGAVFGTLTDAEVELLKNTAIVAVQTLGEPVEDFGDQGEKDESRDEALGEQSQGTKRQESSLADEESERSDSEEDVCGQDNSTTAGKAMTSARNRTSGNSD
jgi:hypothetical protein